MSLPKLTIQIVGWNSYADLNDSLRSIQKFPRDKVIVRYIDNASRDKSVELVRRLLPQAKIIINEENKGFAGGHNRGFAVCDTPFVMVHNPDLTAKWPAIEKLLLLFDNPKVAAVQGKLLRDAAKTILDSTGIRQALTLDGKERGAGEKDGGQFDKEEMIFAATGACAIYRIDALRQIAYNQKESKDYLEVYDHEFFAYKEDVDAGWRLNKAGWSTLYCPLTLGVHKRAVGARGFLGWGLNPLVIYKRVKSPITRYSIRNYIWMLAKNATYTQLLKHFVFIAARLSILFILTIIYPPRLLVWPESIAGLPKMVKKRKNN